MLLFGENSNFCSLSYFLSNQTDTNPPTPRLNNAKVRQQRINMRERERDLESLVEARLRGIKILEDLTVGSVDVELEIAETRGGEVLEIRNRS